MIENGIIAFLSAGLTLVVSTFTYYLFHRSRERKKILRSLCMSEYGLREDDYFVTFFSEASVPKPVAIKVIRIMSEEVGLDFLRISPYEKFDGLLSKVIDPFDLVEFLYRLEEEFDIAISDNEAESIRNPYDMVEFIGRKTSLNANS